MKYKNKKILVTGGAGFIGSHLCEQLIKENCTEVFSLDNYSTGSYENHISGINYIEGSTGDIYELIKFSPDIVFHFAEYSRVEQSFDDYKKVFKSNIDGTRQVIEFCKDNNAKLIYAGSSTKFGDGGLGREQSPYAWSKATNTELVKNYHTWFGLPYAIVYFYNVYGGREISNGKYATVIAKFCQFKKNNKPIEVVKPGSQKRNFTYISDVIDAILLVAESAYGDDFGIGHPKAYSIYEVAKMFETDIVFLEERKGNRMSADVITDKTKALGWNPTMELEDYIKNFIKKI